MPLRIDELRDEHGVFLVKLARKAIETFLSKRKKIEAPKNAPQILRNPAGVFVTLNKIIDKFEELGGCIGYVLPIKPLIDAVIDVAIAAATEDPRFPPITFDEMSKIIVEVTILTPPEKIDVSDPNEYLTKIKIGRDGLLLRYGSIYGTLLPQVPVEYNWNVKEFLDNLCLKAGLPLKCWKNLDVEIYSYQAAIWKEKEPRGDIIRVRLDKNLVNID